MKKIYIIPGLGENCNAARYKVLIKALKAQGYAVKPVNPDWYRPVSEAIFPVEKSAVIFGFSMGAVVAYLVARKYPCKKVIFASLSPIHTFSFKTYAKNLSSYMPHPLAEELARDVKKIKVSLDKLNMPFIRLAGEHEKGIEGDFLIPKTGHYISRAYIKAITKLV